MSIDDERSLDSVLLSPSEMAFADRLAIERGRTSLELMHNAGGAVTTAARRMAAGGPIAILIGFGKNGGDGLAAAVELAAGGASVEIFRLGPTRDRDASVFAERWTGPVEDISRFEPDRFAVVVDALFGAGLSRPVEGPAAETIERLNRSQARVLAVDLPSGVSGASGQVLGIAVEASETTTFFRRKPGHLLLPGRDLCGALSVHDIGIPSAVLREIAPRCFANEPALFAGALLAPSAVHHKYDRGHVGVFSGGPSRTGAARLAASAALRGGAGLVTVLSPANAMMVNAAHLTAVMLRRCADLDDLGALLEDERLATFVLGPGFGDLEAAPGYALAILNAGRGLVLDADGISAFAPASQTLFGRSRSASATLVMTPHAGEFKRMFPDLSDHPCKPERALLAARRADAVVVLKGSDTVIASPDGRTAIDAQGTPALATAGSGDVLAGLISAQLANGVPAFEACCAAVWVHGTAGAAFGPGLIAEDLPGLIPAALRALSGAPT